MKLRTVRKANSEVSGETAGYGVKSKTSINSMETAQVLPPNDKHPMVCMCALERPVAYDLVIPQGSPFSQEFNLTTCIFSIFKMCQNLNSKLDNV